MSGHTDEVLERSRERSLEQARSIRERALASLERMRRAAEEAEHEAEDAYERAIREKREADALDARVRADQWAAVVEVSRRNRGES